MRLPPLTSPAATTPSHRPSVTELGREQVALGYSNAFSALRRMVVGSSEPGGPAGKGALETSPERPPHALRSALRRFFASRRVPEADIDDLVQDVFLRIVRRGAVGEIENFEAYAIATANSVLADRARGRARRSADAHIEFSPEVHSADEIAPDRILAGRQALRATTRALLELPDRARRVFILRRLEGLSFNEIALRLGVSVSSAEKDMKRALQHVIAQAGDMP
jgi:RNA polymerase sigma factor (sigma-70 family)